eukprot:CAMPEP_0198243334 /NCGR_PEP_ID=MMETSP1446-20131203/26882_1 /TAXON_ID=1461542 ORGANISM="Unidentified sp, Strain CCMP2111" /NCGR_SAMPLE_ID=MMETSP1446 /ASSEMBLY_ACC=CAM_ASM_001112 /LENGTH=60 /DNA_ID=CAMNT_0043927129 /DNA_START=60 /DNA_END=239 /DNA_ORIENTATION=+
MTSTASAWTSKACLPAPPPCAGTRDPVTRSAVPVQVLPDETTSNAAGALARSTTTCRPAW